MELRLHINKQATKFRLSVPVDKQFALTVWRLATNVEYQTISKLFGLGISTVCTIVNQTTKVIAQHLLPKYAIRRLPAGSY